MANLGYVSSFNINGNELSLKDAALTEIVEEIIEAIGANNGDISERINNLHDRSFDALIKISSQNESEISSIQDGIYKIQYVTVTGEGDNATEILNDSAILIQKGTNQYLYKDGQISSRTKTNSTWGTWTIDTHPVTSVNGQTGAVTIDVGVTSFNGATGAVTYTAPVTSVNGATGAVTIDTSIEVYECGSNKEIVPGAFQSKPKGYYILHWSDNNDLDESLLVYYNGSYNIYISSVDSNSYYNGLYDWNYDNEYFQYYQLNTDPMDSASYKTIYKGDSDYSEPLQNRNAITGQELTNILTGLGLISLNETEDSETGDTIYKINTDNKVYRFDWAVTTYSNPEYDENENEPDDPINGINGGLDPRIRNLDYLKWTPDTSFGGFGLGSPLPSVGEKAIMGIYFILNEGDNEIIDYTKNLIDPEFGDSYIDSYGVYPNQIKDICLLEIETTSSYTNFMYMTAYNCTATEYLLFGNKKRTINFNWDNTQELHSLDFREELWSNYNYIPRKTSDLTNDSGFLTSAPVTSVNGMTGAVAINVGVTSFNGQTGVVTYSSPVQTVNGQTGNVTINIGVESFNGQTGTITYTAPVTSVDGKTGVVTIDHPVTSVNGQTGAVSLTIPTVPTTSTTVSQNDNNPVSGGAVYNKFADLIGAAPAALDTLGEIAAALNNDADLAGTLTTQISNKIPKVSNPTTDNFASFNSDGTIKDSGHSHSDYITSIKTVNNESLVGTGNIVISGLPQVSAADNGKILMVVNGQWQLVSPSVLYSGSGVPNNAQGNNGDLYVQTD